MPDFAVSSARRHLGISSLAAISMEKRAVFFLLDICVLDSAYCSQVSCAVDEFIDLILLS